MKHGFNNSQFAELSYPYVTPVISMSDTSKAQIKESKDKKEGTVPRSNTGGWFLFCIFSLPFLYLLLHRLFAVRFSLFRLPCGKLPLALLALKKRQNVRQETAGKGLQLMAGDVGLQGWGFHSSMHLSSDWRDVFSVVAVHSLSPI